MANKEERDRIWKLIQQKEQEKRDQAVEDSLNAQAVTDALERQMKGAASQADEEFIKNFEKKYGQGLQALRREVRKELGNSNVNRILGQVEHLRKKGKHRKANKLLKQHHKEILHVVEKVGGKKKSCVVVLFFILGTIGLTTYGFVELILRIVS